MLFSSQSGRRVSETWWPTNSLRISTRSMPWLRDPLFEALEHGRRGAFIGNPLELLELEGLGQRLPLVLPDVAADHDDPPAPGGAEEILELLALGVHLVLAGLIGIDAVEVATQAEVLAAEQLAVGAHAGQDSGVGGAQAGDDLGQCGEELGDPLVRQAEAGERCP